MQPSSRLGDRKLDRMRWIKLFNAMSLFNALPILCREWCGMPSTAQKSTTNNNICWVDKILSTKSFGFSSFVRFNWRQSDFVLSFFSNLLSRCVDQPTNDVDDNWFLNDGFVIFYFIRFPIQTTFASMLWLNHSSDCVLQLIILGSLNKQEK